MRAPIRDREVVTMNVRVIEADRYLVTMWEAATLDDSSFSIVERIFDSNDAAFFFWCSRHRDTKCHCIETVKQFRIDCHLDTPEKRD
jgi:hypothetical protein